MIFLDTWECAPAFELAPDKRGILLEDLLTHHFIIEESLLLSWKLTVGRLLKYDLYIVHYCIKNSAFSLVHFEFLAPSSIKCRG